MPVEFNLIDGHLDAMVIEENFYTLDQLLKEGITSEDVSGKFTKYKVRRYSSGKIVSFNSGSSPYSSSRDASITGTFENNWSSGAKSIKHSQHNDDYFNWVNPNPLHHESFFAFNSGEYNDPNDHPFELLGFPGGSFYYDFQEQGIPNLKQIYDDDGTMLLNWPPEGNSSQKFPKEECWSRWLTVPDAAGSVYVDEPCVAIITATVKGDYFFTPAMRVHGVNSSSAGEGRTYRFTLPEDGSTKTMDTWQLQDYSGLGEIKEGMDQSAMLRLGLFVDTNPIVWEDEFLNKDDYGQNTTFGHGHNPWIGSNPKGDYEPTKPDGVATARSWIKVRELTYRVRQKGTYKIVAAIKLKGRRKYNFSLKFRPAGYYGYTKRVTIQSDDGGKAVSGAKFVEGYAELESELNVLKNYKQHAYTSPAHAQGNPTWKWSETLSAPYNHYWFWPGVDTLATSFVESSSIGVEFFYGCTLSNNANSVANMLYTEDEGE